MTLPYSKTIPEFKLLVIAFILCVLMQGNLSAQEVTNQVSTRSSVDDLPQVKHLIDTHIHLYDTARDKGVPWPPKEDKVLYKPHLPAEFKTVSQKAGATGVVIVEASTWPEDNQWVLDLIKDDDFFVALVGNIDPYRKDFGKELKRLGKDKRLVGIRARVSGKKVDYSNRQVLKSFRSLAKQNLALDVLMNGEGVETLNQVTQVAQQNPKLRIIVNHVLGYDIDGKLPEKEWIDGVKKLAENKNVFVKISGLYQRCATQPASKDVNHYRELLDILWVQFGEDRLIYGSNWPCTKKSGDYTSFVKLVNQYFSEKGQLACEKYFWKNASKAYNLKLK